VRPRPAPGDEVSEGRHAQTLRLAEHSPRRHGVIRVPVMISGDRRARATGRKGRRTGQRFAMVPVEVMQSEACRTLDPTIFKVLSVLAAQYRGSNNGLLTLPLSEAKKFGIRSSESLNRGLKELLERGLIEKTHQGGLPPYGCSMNALCWLDKRSSRDNPIQNAATPKDWLAWTMPADAKRRRPPAAPRVHRGASPTIGRDSSVDRTAKKANCSDDRTTYSVP
jgi:hypothetical protein